MRIAVVSAFMYDQSVGGIENYIRFAAKALIRQGHDVLIFSPVWKSRKEIEPGLITQDGVESVRVPVGKRPFNLRSLSGRGGLGIAAAFLNKVSFTLRPDPLVHAVSSWAPSVVWQNDFLSSWRATRILARRFPVVLTNHTGEYLYLKNLGRFGDAILRRLLNHYKAVIGPSEELTPRAGPPAFLIHSGVDLERFSPLGAGKRTKLRTDLFGSDQRFVILCPRRWAPTKGVLYLARALKRLEEWGTNRDQLLVIFAGDAHPDYPRYVRDVERVLDEVSIPFIRLGTPDVYQLIPYYQAADLVVIPSLMEAVSLAALEAMACETAVLATQVGGMTEAISDGETGYLTMPGNVDALGKSLLRAWGDSNREKIAARGRELVRSSYGWGRQADRIAAVLTGASGGSAA